MSDTPTVDPSEVDYLWHHAYYDVPLSGACMWRGKRYWFVCVDVIDVERYDKYIFHLVELTDEEWSAQDDRHECFRQYVSCTNDHTDDKYGPVRPQSEHHKYYDKYHPNEDRTGEWASRPAVARYEE